MKLQLGIKECGVGFTQSGLHRLQKSTIVIQSYESSPLIVFYCPSLNLSIPCISFFFVFWVHLHPRLSLKSEEKCRTVQKSFSLPLFAKRSNFFKTPLKKIRSYQVNVNCNQQIHKPWQTSTINSH